MSALSAATPAPESNIPADMQPLRIQLGGAKRAYQCQVEGLQGGPINLTGSCLRLHQEGASGSGVGVPTLNSAAKPFSIWTSSASQENSSVKILCD